MRGDPELRPDGDTGRGHRGDRFRTIGGAIELDHVRPGFLDEAHARPHGGVRALLQRAVGQIAIEKRAGRAAPNGLCDRQHLVHGHFKRARLTPEIDAHRIADGHDLHAGAIGNAGHLIVPDNDADDLVTVAFHLLELRNRRFSFGHLSYAAIGFGLQPDGPSGHPTMP